MANPIDQIADSNVLNARLNAAGSPSVSGYQNPIDSFNLQPPQEAGIGNNSFTETKEPRGDLFIDSFLS